MLETNAMFKKVAIGNDKLHPLTDNNIKAIQNLLLEMLQDIDSLCQKYNLTYFLAGGTALGAVRHKGFIPWDEDADLCMPRADYDKLIDLIQQEYSDKYWAQSFCTTDKSDLIFLKIRKKGTRYLELFETDPEHAGIFIDIYPIENIPNFAPLRFFHGLMCDFLYLCCSCVRVSVKKQRFLEYLGDNKKSVKLVKIKSAIGKVLSFMSLHKWCKVADKWSKCCKNDNSKYITIPSGIKHYFGEICSRESFLPQQKITFSNMQLPIMAKPEEYLTGLYGDYMKIPTEDERERHTVLELDLGEVNA